LDELWAHATREEFAWTQKWQVGDLIIWDNRCTMHRRDGLRRPRPPPHAPADDQRGAAGLTA
jgi:alpha-ketoglutarate-dependent taurine dioxygenase